MNHFRRLLKYSKDLMEFKIILTMLVWSSSNILIREGYAANQMNQNSTLIVPSTSTISGTSMAANSSTSFIEPSSTILQASSALSSDTLQMSAHQSYSNTKAREVVLPPESDRRDFNLVANTRLRWVRYLLDKSGPEFSVLKQHVEDHLYTVYKDVPGFLKTDVTEFKERVVFYAIIYTRKEEQVFKSKLEALLRYSMSSELTNKLTIDSIEITPRFNEMSSDDAVSTFDPPKGEPQEKVDGVLAFFKGFGAMLGLSVVFVIIGLIKYKACHSKKIKDGDQKKFLQDHVNEVQD